MEPLAIVAFTGGVVGQLGLIFFWCRPLFNCIRRLIDCLRHPRPPPPQAVSAEKIFKAMKERFQSWWIYCFNGSARVLSINNTLVALCFSKKKKRKTKQKKTVALCDRFSNGRVFWVISGGSGEQFEGCDWPLYLLKYLVWMSLG